MLTTRDSTLQVRQGIVTVLKAAGMARVYGPQVPALPTWPFVRVAVDDSAPFEAKCINGSSVTLTVHTFYKGEGENEVAAMNQTVAMALHGVPIDLNDGSRLTRLRWVRSQIIRDTDEATGWHGIVSLVGTVVTG